MQPFLTFKKILILFCILPSPNGINSRAKNISFSCFILITLLLSFLSSSVYFFKFVKSDTESSLFALWQSIAYISPMYTLVAACLMQKRFINVFIQIEDIYNSGRIIFRFTHVKNKIWNVSIDDGTELNKMLLDTDERNEGIIKFMLKYIFGGFIIVSFSLATINVMYCIVHFGYIDVENLFVPYELV